VVGEAAVVEGSLAVAEVVDSVVEVKLKLSLSSPCHFSDFFSL